MRRRLAFLLTALLFLPVGAKAAEDFEAAEAYYEAHVDRPPLATRLGAFRRLARTGDPRALAILRKRYARPRVPKEDERYLIAAEIGRHFSDARHVEALRDWMESEDRDENAWLWFHASGAEVRAGDLDRVRAAILSTKTRPFLRAALLERLAVEARPEGLALVPRLAGEEMPREGLDRTLLLESCAAVLLAHREALGTPAFEAVARALVDVLARDDVEERSKLAIARHLARTFRVDTVTTDPAWWRRAIAATGPVDTSAGTVAGRPRFFGLEAAGSRIVYLLDLSDSMLEPLTEREIRDARDVPGVVEGEEGTIDWTRIRNRFDLARAYLQQSLESLPSDVSFMVIGFGDHAAPFQSTRRLERATRTAVGAAVRELQDIEPGRVTPQRPHGTLRGATNLHGALRLAFRATTRRDVDELEHADEGALERGCDTIFVFGDGRPTEDDFAATDRFDGGRITTDTETGAVGEAKAGSARYYGPYRAVGNLLQDVQRMNLFRKAEIHAIAMGEADNDLMRRLADLGLGRYRSIGYLGRDGWVNAWWVVGPFPAPDIASWQQAEPPEEAVVLSQPVRIGDRSAWWERVFARGAGGVVPLDGRWEADDHVAAYAHAEIVVPEAVEARLALGSDDGVRVWLNGEVVHTKFEKRGLKPGQDRVDVALRAGENRLLLKVCDDRGAWAFAVRILDRDGRPLDFRIR